jgi:chaperonin cofactor prefoldin
MATQDDVKQGTPASGDEQLDTLKKNVARLKRKVDDQSERIEALARGREKSMSTVGELREELALVAAERDRLRKQLTDLEGMQTETQTLDDDAISDETDAHQGELPSIDELMATFSGDAGTLSASHSTVRVEADATDAASEYEEMISPDLIVLGSNRSKPGVAAERYLVLLEAGNRTKCPLNEDLLTIGRSDSADIQVEGDFISRIHARILRIGMDSVVEDAGSKNGTRVNGEMIRRHVLKHGDLIRVGSANFRFVDTASGDGNSE